MKINQVSATARTAHAVASKLAGLLVSGLTWLIAFAFGSAACVSVGVYTISGLGWSLISAGSFMMLFAVVIFRGIGHE